MTKHPHMTSKELKRAIVTLYGPELGGQRRLAEEIGKNELTVSRWATDRAPIGETEAILIRLLVKIKRKPLTEKSLSQLD